MSGELLPRLRSLIQQEMPLPAHGQTPLRHSRLMEVGREDLSLARLAEAHWDAVAILAEAGREAEPGAIYGVWASEIAGQPLCINRTDGRTYTLLGTKMFCSGATLIDRALVTADRQLVDIDLHGNENSICFDGSAWKTDAFSKTKTAKVTFQSTPFAGESIVEDSDWYLDRPGFWHGACGPAACWAGGAAALLDYAMEQAKEDPHTLAHLGAIAAAVWANQSYLESAGREIDEFPGDGEKARVRALTVRHLVEQGCTDIIRRLSRAYGPHPLALTESVSLRVRELDLYLRQSHAERDLEWLGSDLKKNPR